MKFLSIHTVAPQYFVTPYAGVWIEIYAHMLVSMGVVVTPYAGVWIEMNHSQRLLSFANVTPYAGVWIEIIMSKILPHSILSLPTRECGLKFIIQMRLIKTRSHSLRGSVD